MNIKYLKIKEVIEKMGIGKSTFFDWTNPKSPRFKADFPKAVKIGKVTRYVESEINEYQLKQMAAR